MIESMPANAENDAKSTVTSACLRRRMPAAVPRMTSSITAGEW